MTEPQPSGYEGAILRTGQAAIAAVFSLILAGSLITAHMRWPAHVDSLIYPGLMAFVLALLVSRRTPRPVVSLGLVQVGILLIAAHGLLPQGLR